jgi:hypothetical protein
MAMVWSGARVTEELGSEGDSSSDDDLANGGTADKGRHGIELTEIISGIEWKFANQGEHFPVDE